MLTFLRIALIPVLVAVYYLPLSWGYVLTTAVFGLASATDWLDGYLARRLNQSSRFGAFLDPVADKLLVAVALVLLVESYPTAWMTIAAAVIIGREITVSALREWMAEIGERTEVKVSNLGKYKTGFQITAICMLLFREELLWLPMDILGMFFLALAVVLTLWSMVLYLRAAWPLLNNEKGRASE